MTSIARDSARSEAARAWVNFNELALLLLGIALMFLV